MLGRIGAAFGLPAVEVDEGFDGDKLIGADDAFIAGEKAAQIAAAVFTDRGIVSGVRRLPLVVGHG